MLVEAAKQRQVVVLTYDIVFLLMLTKYARIAAIPLTERSLRRGSPRHGLLEEGPPWVAMSVARPRGSQAFLERTRTGTRIREIRETSQRSCFRLDWAERVGTGFVLPVGQPGLLHVARKTA